MNRQAPQLIDLSHTIEDGLVTYKGLPAPIVCDYLTREDSKKIYAPGTEFQIGKIEMVTNTGTYVDCPFHRFAHGADTSEVPLERFAELEGIVIRLPFGKGLSVTHEQLKGHDVKDKAVLIHTGWDIHWNTERYYEHHAHLTAGAAEHLRDKGALLVGIDSFNIDDIADLHRPVHTILLGSGILIVEHMCGLSGLPDSGFKFSAVPPKFKGVGTFPVRAMARVYGS